MQYKNLILKSVNHAAAFTFITLVIIIPNYVSARTSKDTPHIDGNVQLPPTRWGNVRHTFDLHVPKDSKPVTQIIIKVPNTIDLSNNTKDISVSDQSNHKINTYIYINNKLIRIFFPKPIVSNTKFSIDINNVNRGLFVLIEPIYQIWAKEVGSDTAIPIGTALFHTY